MRTWFPALVLVALASLPAGRGFLPAPPAARLLLRGSGNGTPGSMRRESRGAASLRAILDKIPLPQSPRPSEIMKRLENKEVRRRACACARERFASPWRMVRALRDAPRGARFQVQGSLDRFIKSAPEGLKRAAEAAIPVAKVFEILFNLTQEHSRSRKPLFFKVPQMPLKALPHSLSASTVFPAHRAMILLAREPQAVLFNEDLKKGDALPAGWTEHLDEKTGLPYYYAASTASTVWQLPTEPAPPASRFRCSRRMCVCLYVCLCDGRHSPQLLAPPLLRFA